MMKSLMFCVFFCISSSQGLRMSFDGTDNFHGTVPQLTCRRYGLVYERGTYFSLYLQMLGEYYSKLNITEFEVFVKKQAGILLLHQRIPKPTSELMFDLNLDYDKITVDVQFSTNLSCQTVRVLEGKEFWTLTGDKHAMISKSNGYCLMGKRCLIVINLKSLCEVSDEKLKPQPCNVDYNLPTQASASADEDLELSETLMAAWNFLGFVTQKNSSTSSAKSNLKEGADNTYFTIMIVALVIATVTTILLLIIIIRQRYWVNCNPRVVCLPPFSPINENRFYENVVFRPNSQPDVEQRGPHIYDEPSVKNSSHRAQLN